MTEQLDLADAEPIIAALFENPTKPLTKNQQLAFDYIRAHDGVSVDEIGAYLHAHRDKRPHSVDVRCDWCAKTGLQTVKSKGLGPLVTYRRSPQGNLYIARDPADRIRNESIESIVEPTEAELASDPFVGL